MMNPVGWAEAPVSDVRPTEQEARVYCERSANNMRVLAEDMASYMTDRVSDYLRNSPGDLGITPEPGGTGY